jgi:23S rRNA-/tRNA-specific pseudouridylate synthase
MVSVKNDASLDKKVGPTFLVVNKPAGWLTVPGRGDYPVLSRELEREHGKIWVVHRLDRETSGVVLFALTAEAHRLACGWFEKHQVVKYYDLLAVGKPSAPVMRLAEPIDGKRAITQLEVKEVFGGGSAFRGRARIITGRTHQIRIHLAGKGHALLGDSKYGGSCDLAGRVALHASRLELPTGECYEFDWPEDFKSWVETLRKL